MQRVKTATDLEVYKLAFVQATKIFVMSKTWPAEEKYSLTDQIRRCSRSVCANLREAWAKRKYPAHFASKLTDADAENGETETWLDLAFQCGYLPEQNYKALKATCARIGAMLGRMLATSDSFCH